MVWLHLKSSVLSGHNGAQQRFGRNARSIVLYPEKFFLHLVESNSFVFVLIFFFLKRNTIEARHVVVVENERGNLAERVLSEEFPFEQLRPILIGRFYPKNF